MVTYHFHTSHTPYAQAIELYSKYSHVSIEVGGYVYEAVIFDKYSRRGVIKTPVEFYERDTIVKSVSLELNEREVINFLNEQVGKGYDFMGVLSFVWRVLPNRMGYWYCSELATVSLAKGKGITEYSQKQTPEDFYYLTQWSK